MLSGGPGKRKGLEEDRQAPARGRLSPSINPFFLDIYSLTHIFVHANVYGNAAFPRATLGHGSTVLWLRADVWSRIFADSHSVDGSECVVARRRRGDRTRHGNKPSALPPPSASRRARYRTAFPDKAADRKRRRTKNHSDLQSSIACEII